jgi:hypothetical protein
LLKTFIRNCLAPPFTAALAMLGILGGLRGLVEPGSLPLLPVLGPIAYLWAIVYLTGGLSMLYGLGSLKARFEAAGCVLYAGGTFVQATVTMFFLGVSPFLTFWSALSLYIIGAAALKKARRLTSGDRLIWVRTP